MELALILDGQGGEMSIGCQVSAHSGRFEEPLEDHEMARARIEALNVLPCEPLAYPRQSRLRRQGRLQHGGMGHQSDEPEHNNPWEADRLATRHQALPPFARRAVPRRFLVVREHEKVDVGDDHGYGRTCPVSAKRRASNSSLN